MLVSKGKGKGKGKHKVQQMHQNPYWYGWGPSLVTRFAWPSRSRSYGHGLSVGELRPWSSGMPRLRAAFYEYGMTNPYGYDLGAIYNAMAPGAHMFNGFSMAMPQHPKVTRSGALGLLRAVGGGPERHLGAAASAVLRAAVPGSLP